MGSFLVLAATGVLIAAFAMSGGKPAASAPPPTFNGSWKAQVNDATFVAIITGDGIEIMWNTDTDTQGLYWKGSFPVPLTNGDVLTITSTGDTDTMSNSLLASQDAIKVFTYQNGTLDFKLTVAGVTTTVHLKQEVTNGA